MYETLKTIEVESVELRKNTEVCLTPQRVAVHALIRCLSQGHMDGLCLGFQVQQERPR
jgi:hypothetical protein